MLYKKKNEPVLSGGLFKNPTSEFRGAPFWAWNTKLNKETLLKQIDIFKEMGIGGFHMHVRTGMETEYLSDEFFDYIKLCNEKAKKENMLCWLYDEDRWPSGAAGGFITKNLRYRSRYILLSLKDYHDTDEVYAENYEEFCTRADKGEKLNGYYMPSYGVKFDSDGYLTEYKMLKDGEKYDGTVWYSVVHIAYDSGWYNGQAYLDTLSKTAVEEFVKTTYEAYYKNVGEDFDKSIPAIFTDEPQVIGKAYKNDADDKNNIHIAYTDDFDETYKAKFGESIIEKLPELIWEKRDNGCARTRYRYHDHLSERFVSAFVDTIGSWCEKHNIAFTGHMMQEPTLRSQVGSLGEAMRCYRNFQIPGMDLLCDNIEYTTAKQVQSAVHQYGREGMLSELYGVTGWDYDFRGHKRQGDWQSALGVTVRVHHLTWVSMNGDAKHDYPACIGYQSPWYKEYSLVENHFARLYTALTRGTPDVHVGIIHPVESYWMITGPNDKTLSKRDYFDGQFLELTKKLCTSGIDFDFISESLLPSLCEKGSAPLTVGKMKYDTIVVPLMYTMRSTTLERLNDFAKAGGKIILIGQPARFVDGERSSLAEKSAESWIKIDVDYIALINKLEDDRFVNFYNTEYGTNCDNILHQLRNDGNGKWLFFCHGEDMKNRGWETNSNYESVRVELNGKFNITEYNTLTGEIYTPAYKIENGKTYAEYKLFAEDSVLLRLDNTDAEGVFEGNAPEKLMPFENKSIRQNFKGVTLFDNDITSVKPEDYVPYSLDEPNAVLLDMCRYSFDGEEYRPTEDSVRIGDIGRKLFYEKYQSQTTIQPWVPIPEELKNDKGHTVKREFTFQTEIELKDTCLALEMSDVARIFVNGKEIEKKFLPGYYVDECIKKVQLPVIPAGKAVIEVETPFSLRGRTEWCYVLGDFGVKVTGKYVTCYKRNDKIAFGNIVDQGLPFYTGNITYHTSFVEPFGGERTIQLPGFFGPLAKVSVDKKEEIPIAFAPNCAFLGELSKGKHTLDIKVFGNRYNGFGPVHNNRTQKYYMGPASWRTYDSPLWSDQYRLKPIGVLVTPLIY